MNSGINLRVLNFPICILLITTCFGFAVSFPSSSLITLPEGYNRHLRPNHDGVADTISLTLEELILHSVDENKHNINVEMRIRTAWEDNRLSSLVEKETMISDPKGLGILIPSISISHSIQMSSEVSSVSIRPGGTITANQRIFGTFPCPLPLFRYPFGSPHCQLRFLIEGFSSLHITLLWNGIIPPTSFTSMDGVYSIRSIDQEEGSKRSQEGGEIPFLQVDLHLSRSSIRELFMVIIPSGVMAGVAYYLTFFLKMQTQQKKKQKSQAKLDFEETEEEESRPHSPIQSPQEEVDKMPMKSEEFIKLAVISILFIILFALNQSHLLLSSPGGGGYYIPTALDIWTATMSGITFVCWVVQIRRCITNEGDDDQTENVKHRLRKCIRIIFPILILLFIFTFFGLCLL